MITEEDARKLVQIVMTADNGCPYCASNLIERLMAAVPDVDWKTITRSVDADFNVDELRPHEGDWRSTG